MIARMWGFLLDAVRDPDCSTSMTRIAALWALILTTYAVYADRDPMTIGALMGGGAVALLTRKKTGDE